MDYITPNKRGKISAILCIVFALYFQFFTTVNFIIVLELLFLSVLFIIIHLLLKNIDIRYAHILFYVLAFLCIYLFFSFSNTNIGFKIAISDLDKQIYKHSINYCQDGCEVEQNKIYDDENIVYKWYGFSRMYDGYVKVENNKIEYQLSFENKCVTKKYDNDYIISNNKCDD